MREIFYQYSCLSDDVGLEKLSQAQKNHNFLLSRGEVRNERIIKHTFKRCILMNLNSLFIEFSPDNSFAKQIKCWSNYS